ncbi:MAG TPA: methyl-coenzyme M reductase I operon protein C [Candidatus Methanofastidiosa archaeon]|nr:methyl-coenzyme M reductase I operon protein C [Candidatus Methanofastidiosa archaeon]
MERKHHIVNCRAAMGMGLGGGMAQRGTIAMCGGDVVAIAMSPGRRHITKPVCEITYALREEEIDTSVLVLNAGTGVPSDCPYGKMGARFGLEDEEIEKVKFFKLAMIHHGNVKNHLIYKTRFILNRVEIPAVIVCQIPVDFEDFAKIGIKTRLVRPKEPVSKGEVVDIIYGVTRGVSVEQKKLDEIVFKVRDALNKIERNESDNI